MRTSATQVEAPEELESEGELAQGAASQGELLEQDGPTRPTRSLVPDVGMLIQCFLLHFNLKSFLTLVCMFVFYKSSHTRDEGCQAFESPFDVPKWPCWPCRQGGASELFPWQTVRVVSDSSISICDIWVKFIQPRVDSAQTSVPSVLLTIEG